MPSNCYHPQSSVEVERPSFSQHRYIPLMDIVESNQDFKYLFAMPGLKSEQIEVSIEDNYLQVVGQSSWEEGQEKYLHKEIVVGKFERDALIPHHIDSENPRVHLQNGILEVVFNKIISAGTPSQTETIS